MCLRHTDLPLPEPPRIVVVSPSRICRSTPRSTGWRPNALWMPESSITLRSSPRLVRLAHRITISWVRKKSVTSTPIEAATTARVVARPTPTVPPVVWSAVEQPTIAISQPNTNVLRMPENKSSELNGVGDRLEVEARVDPELAPRQHEPAEHAEHVGEHGEQRQRERGREHARQHELLHRVRAHRADRVDLLGHLHRADLGGDPRAHAAAHHQRREHRAQLARERQPDHRADVGLRSEARQRDAGLEREHHARE